MVTAIHRIRHVVQGSIAAGIPAPLRHVQCHALTEEVPILA